MPCNQILQKPLPGFIIDSPEKKKKGKTSLEGCRISPSKLELISKIQERCLAEDRPPNETDYSQTQDLDTLYPIIYSSIYGQYFHYLQYSTQFATRCNSIGRVPNELDIRNTFPKQDTLFSNTLSRIIDMSAIYQSQHPIEKGLDLWETWRMNGFDFTPAKHKNFKIPATEVRRIWEYENPALKDIDTFMNSFDTSRREVDPSQAILLNEVFLLTNILFEDGNIQVPTFIDEIRIYNDFPKSALEIVDYKTGDQFRKPGEKEKVQIFLMMTACIKMLDLGHKGIWTNDWNSLPYINSKSKYISSISFDSLIEYSDIFKNAMSFKYINPVTQEEIKVSSSDIGIDSREGIVKKLVYLHNMGVFYKENRDVLKHALDSKNAPFTLPTFPIPNFTKGNGYSRNTCSPLL